MVNKNKLDAILDNAKQKISKLVLDDFDLEVFNKKKKKYKEKRRLLKLKEKEIEFKLKEIELKDEDLEKRLKEVELSINLNEASAKSFCLEHQKLQQKSEQLMLWEKEIKVKQRKFDEEVRLFRVTEKEVEDERIKQIELKRQFEELRFGFEENMRLFRAKEKQVEEERIKQSEFKQRQLEFDEKVKEKEKQVQEESGIANDAEFNACAVMNGYELLIYLNERWAWKKQQSMEREVFRIIRLSSDPAKLVLDAVRGFYPPHDDDSRFEIAVVRKTCILLFEQLIIFCPEISITDDMKNEAVELSSDWFVKMKDDVEVLGFLMLVAVYGLVNSFDDDKLLNYLVVVAQHTHQAPKLLRTLGFENKISGFIQNLLENKGLVDAIKFVQELELTAQYPLAPLMKDYLVHSENSAKVIINDGNKSLMAKNEAREKRIADVKDVLKCIEDYKLESKFPPDDVNYLTMLIQTLENEIENDKDTPAATLGPSLQGLKKKKKTHKKIMRLRQARVENLITHHEHIAAIKSIFEWGLVENFPPVSLLKDFLAYSKTKAEDICKTKNKSTSSQSKALDYEICALEQVIRCIQSYELENEYPSAVLEQRLNELKMQREKAEQQNEDKQIVVAGPQLETKMYTTVGLTTKETIPLGTIKETSPSTTAHSGNKRPLSPTSSSKMKQPKMENGNKRCHFSAKRFHNRQRRSYYDPYKKTVPRHYNLANTAPLYYDPHVWTASIPSHNEPHMWYANSPAGIPSYYSPYMGSGNRTPYH